MPEEISKQSTLKPASFESRRSLTKGQEKLLVLLKEKINSNSLITKDDIVDLYFSTIECDGRVVRREYRSYNPEGQKWVDVEYTKNSWSIRTAAFQWFKNNLGSCILKGKLLVIPIIEL